MMSTIIRIILTILLLVWIATGSVVAVTIGFALMFVNVELQALINKKVLK